MFISEVMLEMEIEESNEDPRSPEEIEFPKLN
jgi:hypothetical protein